MPLAFWRGNSNILRNVEKMLAGHARFAALIFAENGFDERVNIPLLSCHEALISRKGRRVLKSE